MHKPNLTIQEIRVLFLLVHNNYMISYVALDLGKKLSVISRLIRIMAKKLPPDFFIYYTKEDNPRGRAKIKGINVGKYNKFIDQGLILNEAYENVCEELAIGETV